MFQEYPQNKDKDFKRIVKQDNEALEVNRVCLFILMLFLNLADALEQLNNIGTIYSTLANLQTYVNKFKIQSTKSQINSKS